MNQVIFHMKRFIQDEGGASAVEYGVLAALIIVVSISVITTLGTNLKAVFEKIRDALAP